MTGGIDRKYAWKEGELWNATDKKYASEAVGATSKAKFSGQNSPLLELYCPTSGEKNQSLWPGILFRVTGAVYANGPEIRIREDNL